MTSSPLIPLSNWADGQLERLARLSGSGQIARLTGSTLLGERGYLNGYRVPGDRSAGGGCRLFKTANGPVALNLSRQDDRALLPALFGSDTLQPDDGASIAAHMATADSLELVARGREMGLAIAAVNEPGGGGPAIDCPAPTVGQKAPARPPLVVDMSALWAGPLAGHLLWLAGAQVIKVENPHRPDGMRRGTSPFFALLNQGKRSVALDIRQSADRDALLALLARSDIVIESTRPRALLQLGIDADKLVRERPGLTWVSITGHGIQGTAGHWVGFGDDCSVAGGLTAAMARTTGQMAFAGDAVADPLTGIMAALAAYETYRQGRGGRYFLSMSGIVALALREETERNPEALAAQFANWAAAKGKPFAPTPERGAASVAPLGQDTHAVLAEMMAC